MPLDFLKDLNFCGFFNQYIHWCNMNNKFVILHIRRALAQRCPEPPMKNFISLAGQHQGVYGLPNCPSVPRNTCNYYRRLLNYAAYAYWIQSLLVQATYWHSPLDEDLYRRKSTFLAEINNEMFKNETYIKNLQNLKK